MPSTQVNHHCAVCACPGCSNSCCPYCKCDQQEETDLEDCRPSVTCKDFMKEEREE